MAKFLQVDIAGLEYAWQALKPFTVYRAATTCFYFNKEYFYILHNLYLEWMYAIGQINWHTVPIAICTAQKPLREGKSTHPFALRRQQKQEEVLAP